MSPIRNVEGSESLFVNVCLCNKKTVNFEGLYFIFKHPKIFVFIIVLIGTIYIVQLSETSFANLHTRSVLITKGDDLFEIQRFFCFPNSNDDVSAGLIPDSQGIC